MNMMILRSFVFLLGLLAMNLQAHEGRVTVRVIGEDGLPIADAKVEAQLESAGAPGSGWGNTSLNSVKGITDVNGLCVLTGKGDEPSVVIGVLKEGTYGADGYGVEFTGSILGRWQPWNPTIEVVLQKIGVQVPMYARKFWEGRMPVENKPCGFDLMAGDWVAPYGKGGASDFVFELDHGSERTITNRYGSVRLYDNKLTINFSNDGDGIQSLVATSHSGLKSPRLAPLEGYQPTLEKRDALEEITDPTPHEKEFRITERTILDYQNNVNYFFRVRTKKDASGNITNALYGKIYGEFGGYVDMRKTMFRLSFTYYLNPEPNSRNMEFDPKQNLFKNLKPLEQIAAP
jgi:hypothetical protein